MRFPTFASGPADFHRRDVSKARALQEYWTRTVSEVEGKRAAKCEEMDTGKGWQVLNTSSIAWQLSPVNLPYF
jgi:hypothetical protein